MRNESFSLNTLRNVLPKESYKGTMAKNKEKEPTSLQNYAPRYEEDAYRTA